LVPATQQSVSDQSPVHLEHGIDIPALVAGDALGLLHAEGVGVEVRAVDRCEQLRQDRAVLGSKDAPAGSAAPSDAGVFLRCVASASSSDGAHQARLDRYSSTVALAERFQLNWEAWAIDRAATPGRSESPARRAISRPRAMSSGSYGSTRNAASPATSGIDERFDVTVGA